MIQKFGVDNKPRKTNWGTGVNRQLSSQPPRARSPNINELSREQQKMQAEVKI